VHAWSVFSTKVGYRNPKLGKKYSASIDGYHHNKVHFHFAFGKISSFAIFAKRQCTGVKRNVIKVENFAEGAQKERYYVRHIA
jgi:hypothetical protein